MNVLLDSVSFGAPFAKGPLRLLQMSLVSLSGYFLHCEKLLSLEATIQHLQLDTLVSCVARTRRLSCDSNRKSQKHAHM